MARRAKPSKGKVEAKRPLVRKSPKDEGAKVRDLEKRLAESLEREKAKDRALAEALEQQAATAAILRVISSSPTDVQPVFDTIVRSALRLLGGFSSTLRELTGDHLNLVAFSATGESGDEALRGLSQLPLTDDPLFAQVVRDRAPCVASDTERDPRVGSRRREVARARGYRSMLIVPMLRGGDVIGVITVTRREPGPFAEDQIGLLGTFADQAVLAIENARLFTELQTSNRDLTTALDTQTATSDILRVISRSQTDVQPVFDAIVDSAGRLCGAESATVYRFEGEMAHFVAGYHLTPEILDAYQRLFPCPLRETEQLQRVIDGSVLNIADIDDDPHTSSRIRDVYHSRHVRSAVFVPMVREGRAIGAIGVAHHDLGAFSDERVELLKTFADQAVIAIENVRLFKELELRNAGLSEALMRETATGEILR